MAGDLPLALLPLAPEKRPISLWLWWLGFAGDEGAKDGRCGRPRRMVGLKKDERRH